VGEREKEGKRMLREQNDRLAPGKGGKRIRYIHAEKGKRKRQRTMKGLGYKRRRHEKGAHSCTDLKMAEKKISFLIVAERSKLSSNTD